MQQVLGHRMMQSCTNLIIRGKQRTIQHFGDLRLNPDNKYSAFSGGSLSTKAIKQTPPYVDQLRILVIQRAQLRDEGKQSTIFFQNQFER